MNVLELSMPRAIVHIVLCACALYFIQSGTVSMIVKLTCTLHYDTTVSKLINAKGIRRQIMLYISGASFKIE